MNAAQNHFCTPPLFDPEEGTTIIEPKGEESGYWAGACSAVYDHKTRKFYLSYRVRQPRPVRGGHCFVAESLDGISFQTIWSATKEDFGSTSIEKSSLLQRPDGTWLLYISYVDPADSRWRTDVLEGATPADFDVSKRRKVLTADDIRGEGVKDPYAFTLGGKYYLLLSYAPKPQAPSLDQESEMHATADIYNTGITKSSSGLASSTDGLNFQWEGDVFSPADQGWDSYAARLGSFLILPPIFAGFYDGSADVAENYEERTGIATSFDLRRWERVTAAGPILTSPHKTGSLRYIYPVDLGEEIYYYYEYVRENGSHELRLNRVKK